MINEKNATYFFVGNVANGIADEATYTGMAKGSIAVVRALDNKNEETALAGTPTVPVRIVQKKTDGSYVFSPIFTYGDILAKESENFAANTQQVSYFGYDGTSNTTGFGTIVAGDTYTLSIILNHSRNTYNNAPEIKTVPFRAITTSQADMAKGLQESFIRQFSTLREPNPVIRCERVADVASVAAHDTATIALLTKGSTSVALYTKTVAADATLTASATTIAAGTIVNVPSSGGRTFTFNALDTDHVIYIGETSYVVPDAGTAADGSDNQDTIVAAINAGTQATATASSTATVTITYLPDTYALPPMVISDADGTPATVAVTIASGDTAPVQYKVSASTTAAATYELDVAFQGETGYVYVGTTSATNIGETTLTTGYWGLKFSGLTQPFDAINDSMVNQLVMFDIASADFGSVAEYKATKPKYGTGTWQSMAYQEFYSQFLNRDGIRSTRPLTKYTLEVDENTGYDIITLTVKASAIQFETIGQTVNSHFRLVIATQAIPTDLDGDALKTVFAVS